MLIGQLSRLTRVPVTTLRFYERRGLISPAQRSGAGYRIYGNAELERVLFLRRALAVGFGLDEISEIIAVMEGRARLSAAFAGAIHTRLGEIEARVADLQRMGYTLAHLLQHTLGEAGMGPEPESGVQRPASEP